MIFKYDHDYHIHSLLSSCSRKPEQTAENILKYALDNKLNSICITDHYWDRAVPDPSGWYAEQDFDHISQIKPLPQADSCRFMFGCEGEMGKNFELSVPSSRYDEFDFIIIPTTHLHMTKYTITPEDAASNERRAELWVQRFDALMAKDLPWGKVGIAHLATGLINHASREEFFKTIALISDDEIHRLFAKAKDIGLAIELNLDDMKFSDSEQDDILRFFRIAKHQGCKFYLGSDSHSPEGFKNAKEIFDRAIKLLDLQESDKFTISK
ncbi:MAG: hypothetical protein E7646_01840 [Ruminococcaceae bacterium]|nr:hypothetical protein [Oscillospiraceae bacterium]